MITLTQTQSNYAKSRKQSHVSQTQFLCESRKLSVTIMYITCELGTLPVSFKIDDKISHNAQTTNCKYVLLRLSHIRDYKLCPFAVWHIFCVNHCNSDVVLRWKVPRICLRTPLGILIHVERAQAQELTEQACAMKFVEDPWCNVTSGHLRNGPIASVSRVPTSPVCCVISALPPEALSITPKPRHTHIARPTTTKSVAS